MADVHLVMLRMVGRGGVMSVPVRAYETESEAKAGAAARQAEIATLLDTHLVFVNGDTATPAGISLRQFLHIFGVEEVGHGQVVVPSGLIEAAPASKIILAS